MATLRWPQGSGYSVDIEGGRSQTLVIGCGNLLRGDDAAGPVLVRRLRQRRLRSGVECADGGTGGVDVAFQMRGRDHVILVDACRREVVDPRSARPGGGAHLVAVDLVRASTPAAPGDAAGRAAIYEVSGEDVERVPPLEGINLHAFRWDHAIAFGRWLLKDDYPPLVTAFLIEAETFEPGAPLSPPVDRAVDDLVELLAARLALPSAEAGSGRSRATVRPDAGA